MVDPHDAEHKHEKDKGYEGMRKEPERLTTQVARSFILRNVSFVNHGSLAKVTPDESNIYYVFRGMRLE